MYLDIKQIKKSVSIIQLIEYYNINLKKTKHNAWSGPCPIHHGDNTNAFHINTDKNVFNCFTRCGGGNVIDLVMKMENLPFYQAALFMYKQFITTPTNEPCITELQLDYDHHYLFNRGIDTLMAKQFQIGFCSHGMMKNRIAIPIHDEQGNLVAYCGRAVDRNTLPKYLFPKGFVKSNYLFNFFRTTSRLFSNHCIIVEGFFDVFFLKKLGYNAVALMGCRIYPKQLELLKTTGEYQYFLMLDGDKAGRKGMISLEQIFRNNYLDYKSVYLPINTQPENAGIDFLKQNLPQIQ